MDFQKFKMAKETFNLYSVEHEANKNIKLREEFVNYFSLEKLSTMNINEYVIGLQNKESFCYCLERTLHELGSISGQPSNKFGVWYSPSKKKYCFENRFGNNYKDAFETLRTALLNLLKDGVKKDYTAIKNNPINSSIKAKILAMYYPDKYMNVYSLKHLDHYLTTFGLNTKELMKSDVLYKREALVNFKNEDEDMKDWSNYVFSIFLWAHYPKDPRAVTTL